jgi:hypothetical protein
MPVTESIRPPRMGAPMTGTPSKGSGGGATPSFFYHDENNLLEGNRGVLRLPPARIAKHGGPRLKGNRIRKAVERTVPFGLFCHSLLIVWYIRHGHPTTDITHRRAHAPWYRAKTEPATLTCLLHSATRSSPPGFYLHACDQPQHKKSSRSSKPGHSPPHNCKS